MDPIVRVPIVSQVEERIRALIESKKYTEGMKLPTENELCQSMNVGRGTVREALRLLTEKSALCALHTSGIGAKVKLGTVDTALMRFVYKKKYSKRKG